MMPVLGVVGACVVIVGVGDLGTALVTCLAITALLVAAGARMRDIGMLAAIAGGVVLLAVLIEPYRMARITSFLDPGGDPGGAGFQLIQAQDRARVRGAVRRRAGGEPAEGLLPPGGAHRHDRRGHRRGARDGGDRRPRRPLRDLRLRRFQDRPNRPRSLREAARGGPDLARSHPGHGQPARRLRPRAADRGAAALRLLRQREHARDARRSRPLAQRRARRERRVERQAVEPRWKTEHRRRRQRWRASARAAPARSSTSGAKGRHSSGRNGGTRRARPRGRRRASGSGR